jgi:glutamine synthetase
MDKRDISRTVLEYIWIGGKGEIRSKTKVIHRFLPFGISYIPEWNYDGSSTWQADSNSDTEIILKPCLIVKDPIRKMDNVICYIVLCDTYDSNNNPTPTNRRYLANKIFQQGEKCEPWFGLEQEYFMELHPKNSLETVLPGFHYCGNSSNSLERKIAEEHMLVCIEAELQISGINSEVSNCQWEFQIGPCEGIQAGDHLIIARYLLERIAEKYDVRINYHPKPDKNINGSGCHINFSTYSIRSRRIASEDVGIKEIHRCIKYLSEKHEELIKVYGNNNGLRLTGFHETSSYDKFSWGIGTRNTSVRIPNQVIRDNCGYFEYRRPAANIDPYLATSNLFKICCLDVVNDDDFTIKH